ncbi:hypothetical protein TCELL_0703 [Thermogladius calderae 1633]|uniref:Uncharacterized protein n=1 Tax=Thermogladius calderae (strain DSM 22663 / VKM B-2946 / 1633) TaxID=1184251 RepID=I3TED9_THEC1|nr:hypothetical protein [Thermogladius calderae]AFK51127.1 hypothetical protein TCELL_0703 [Thermogladius calderae 1633]
MITLTWKYDELYSCPLTLLLDEFPVGRSRAYVVVQSLNYRVNILRRGGSYREVSNVPKLFDAELVLEACRAVSRGIDPKSISDPLVRVVATSFFYGGFGVFVDTAEGETIPLQLEMVSPHFYLYYERSRGDSLDLDTWVRVGAHLRSGFDSIVYDLCGRKMECRGGTYLVCGSRGCLVVSRQEFPGEDRPRIFVDNAPMRHVVKI